MIERKEKSFSVMVSGKNKEAYLVHSFQVGEKEYWVYHFNEIDEQGLRIIHTSLKTETDGAIVLDEVPSKEDWDKIKDLMKDIVKKGETVK